jgi:hypothetical protein
MGEEFDFFDLEGSAKPAVVEKLRHAEIGDPKLLARLIDGHAGFDIDAGTFGLEGDRRRQRADLLEKMKKCQKLARAIVEKVQQNRWVDPAELAVSDLLHGSAGSDLKKAQDYLTLLERIAELPLPADLSAFSGKPTLDPAATRVVAAVADYCGRMGIPFTGEPRAEQTSRTVTHPVKSKAAVITEAVLNALGINFVPKQLATHMKNARGYCGVTSHFRCNFTLLELAPLNWQQGYFSKHPYYRKLAHTAAWCG